MATESIFAIVLVGASLILKPLLTRFRHKLLKRGIVKTVEKVGNTVEYIQQQLSEVDLKLEDLPVVSEILEKVEQIKNSELGSKAQKSKHIVRLLKRLENEVSEEMVDLVESTKKMLFEDKKLQEQANKIQEIFKSVNVNSANVSELAMNVAKSFTPPDSEDSETEEMKALNKVLNRRNGGRRQRK